jgi:hypothetical protein
MSPLVHDLLLVGLAWLGGFATHPLSRWHERRRLRRWDAEEAERILQGEQLMENRVVLDPQTQRVIEVSVPVGSPVLPRQQIRASDFNQLSQRIKAIEDKLRRTR